VAIACGHSFCKQCLVELLRHKQIGSQALSCPLCRRPLHVQREELIPCSLLCKLLQNLYPEAWERRKLAADQREHQSNSSTGLLGLFVSDSVLPKQRHRLHIFEQRYKALIDRVMRGSRRFAMVGISRADDAVRLSDGSRISQFGTEVEIVSCNGLADGRFLIEVQGRRVFQITDHALTDGGFVEVSVTYCSWQSDTPSSSDRQGAEGDVRQAAQAAANLVAEWEQRVRDWGYEQFRGHMPMIHNDIGPRPGIEQGDALALWIAALINPVPGLGVAPEIRQQVMGAATPLERLQIVTEAMESSMRGMVKPGSWKRLVLPYCREQFRHLLLLGLVVAGYGVRSGFEKACKAARGGGVLG